MFYRPSALLTRRRSLVDGELGADLCHQARSCGCSIEFVKPIFHGLKYPYPGTKTYFKTPSSSGICKPPRALLILCTYNMIMIWTINRWWKPSLFSYMMTWCISLRYYLNRFIGEYTGFVATRPPPKVLSVIW